MTAVTDSKGNRTTTRYNILGKPIEINYPDGTSEHFEYHLDGSLALHKAKNGVTTHYTNDFLGRTTKTEILPPNQPPIVTSATFDGLNMLTSTDAEGITTLYTYDGAGRKSTIQVGDHFTRFEYDSKGNLCKTTQKIGPNESDVSVKLQIYNKFNQLEEERTEDGKGTVLKKERFGYDKAGNRNRVTKYFNDEASTTITEYNSHNLPYMITDQTGNVTIIDYDYQFLNELGQKVLRTITTDPLGVQQVIVMDVANRPKIEQRIDPFGRVIAHQENFYDSTGKKVRVNHLVIAPDGSEREVVNSWSYNQMGEVLQVIEAEATELRKVTTSHYNKLGQKDWIIKPDNSKINLEYDALGRLENYYADSFSYTYQYNRNNQLIEVTDNLTKTKTIRKFDDYNNLVEETLAHGLTLCYDYDLIDRPIKVTLSDQSEIKLDYNATQLKAVRRISSDKQELYTHEYVRYDLAGNLLEAQLINGLGPLTFTYDNLGRNTGVLSSYWSLEVPEGGYDPLGNLREHKVSDSRGVVTSQYGYDHLYQLTSETGLHSHTYANDSLYNRVSKDGAIHQINALNQLSDDSKTRYTYTTNGNLETMDDGQIFRQFEFDALDRLITVTEGAEQYRYVYDFLNRRLSKSHFVKNGTDWQQQDQVRYLYQGQNEVGAVDETGKIVELRVLGLSRGAEIGGAVAHEIAGTVLAPLHDFNGSVVSLITAAREVYGSYRYSAYGQVDTSAGSSWNPWQYSSKRLDPETGFNNFGRRHYNAEIGRWISPDPLGFEGGPNLYAYLLNNPLTHFDLYGLMGTNWWNSWGFQALTGLAKLPGHLMEFGHHFMPLPGLADLFSKTGRFMRGEGFTLENANCHSHECLPTKGRQIDTVGALFTNGMGNSCAEMHKTSDNISATHGGVEVKNVYNASHGLLCDLLECAGQAMGLRTRSVDVMLQSIRDELQRMGPDGKLHIYAHSQGGLITHNALKYLSDDQKKQIHVTTFGTAKLITDNKLGSVKNYVSTRDGVPYLLNAFSLVKARFGGKEAVAQRNIEFLPSKTFPIIDHPMNNSTYKDALENAGQRFQEQYAGAF